MAHARAVPAAHMAALGVVILQLLIVATGNYGFFNLLAIVLCIPLLDDSMLPRLWPAPRGVSVPWHCAVPASRSSGRRHKSNCDHLEQPRFAVTAAVALSWFSRPACSFCEHAGWLASLPAGVTAVIDSSSPLRSMNSYGLFAVMTTERRELIFEGSNDAITWKEYGFKWKPGDVKKRPRYCVPHLPRLDWQLWFAALDPQGNCRPSKDWCGEFCAAPSR